MSTTLLERSAVADARAATTMEVPHGVRLKVDPEGFAALCAANPELRLERDADGGVIVMTPASSDGSARNMVLSGRLWAWNEGERLGKVFDSSGGFTLTDGSIRSPDATWIALDRWEKVPIADRRRFARITPDFVVELRSPADSIAELRAKTAAYIAQGVRLAWIIDPETNTVEIQRPGRPPEILVRPRTLSGENVLPGFTLELDGILSDEKG